MTPPGHTYSNLAGQTTEWFATDCKSRYLDNLKNPQQLQNLQKFGWVDSHFTYSLNSQGFRAAEFNNQPGFVALGCSFTQGVGLPNHTVWPSLIADHFALQSWNLGIGGGSMDLCFRLAHHWIPELQPQFVVMLDAPSDRIEIHTNYGAENLQSTDHRVGSNWYLMNYYTREENSFWNTQRNLGAIKHLCHTHHIPFYHWNREEWIMGIESERRDLARDLCHAGPNCHRYFADLVINTIEKDN